MLSLAALFRSPSLGRIWLVVIAATLALVWQQVAGWPARMKWQFKRASAEPVQVFHFPKKFAPEKWDRGLVRVVCEGRSLPPFPSDESFNASPVEGFVVHGHSVLIRSVGDSSSTWTISTPWGLAPPAFWTALILVGAVTLLLVTGGNPVMRLIAERMGSGPTRGSAVWPEVLLAAVVFVLAVLLRVRGFSYPSWENDSPSYFHSVFRVVAGGRPLTTPDRPFGYALVVGTLLRWMPDFRAVLILHMVATMVAATSVGAIVWLAGERLFTSTVARSLCRLAGIATFAALAFNEALLEREWSLLAEAWVAFFLGVQVVFVWLLTSRPRPLASSLGLFAGLCLTGLLTFFTRPNWGFALGFLPLPWVVASLLNAKSWRSFFIWSVSGAATLLVLAAATFGFQGFCRRDTSHPYLYDRARALICWHVPLVLAEIDRRLQVTPDDPQRPVLTEIAEVFRGEIELAKTRGSGAYPSFNFNPDFLFYHGLAHAPNFQSLPVDERTSLCTNLFLSGVRHQPGIYLRKVLSQMRLFFVSPYQSPNLYLPQVEQGIARSEQGISEHEMPTRFADAYAPVLAEAKREFNQQWPSAARLALSLRSVVIFDFLKAAFVLSIIGPLLVLLLAVGVPFVRTAIEWRQLAPVLTAAVWALGSALLSALSTAVTQGLDVQRYLEMSVPLTLLAQVLWPLVAIAVVLAVFGRAAIRRTEMDASPVRRVAGRGELRSAASSDPR